MAAISAFRCGPACNEDRLAVCDRPSGGYAEVDAEGRIKSSRSGSNALFNLQTCQLHSFWRRFGWSESLAALVSCVAFCDKWRIAARGKHNCAVVRIGEDEKFRAHQGRRVQTRPSPSRSLPKQQREEQQRLAGQHFKQPNRTRRSSVSAVNSEHVAILAIAMSPTSTMATSPRELFGGAITALMPQGLIDAAWV